jgi:hypothetical protein
VHEFKHRKMVLGAGVLLFSQLGLAISSARMKPKLEISRQAEFFPPSCFFQSCKVILFWPLYALLPKDRPTGATPWGRISWFSWITFGSQPNAPL